MLFHLRLFATANQLARERSCPGISAHTENRPDVCRADQTSKTIPVPSITSRPPAKAHSLQQPVPFTVPTSSWRCTNSNRTSDAYSNDFPMHPSSLQLTTSFHSLHASNAHCPMLRQRQRKRSSACLARPSMPRRSLCATHWRKECIYIFGVTPVTAAPPRLCK